MRTLVLTKKLFVLTFLTLFLSTQVYAANNGNGHGKSCNNIDEWVKIDSITHKGDYIAVKVASDDQACACEPDRVGLKILDIDGHSVNGSDLLFLPDGNNCSKGSTYKFTIPDSLKYDELCYEQWDANNNSGDNKEQRASDCFHSGSGQIPPRPHDAPTGFILKIEDNEYVGVNDVERGDYFAYETPKFVIDDASTATEFSYRIRRKDQSCPNRPLVNDSKMSNGELESIDLNDSWDTEVLNRRTNSGLPEDLKVCYTSREVTINGGNTQKGFWADVSSIPIAATKQAAVECIYLASKAGDIAGLDSSMNDSFNTSSGHVDYHSSFSSEIEIGGVNEYIENNFPSFTICEGSNCYPQYKTYQDQWQDRVFVDAWCRNKTPVRVSVNVDLKSSLPACHIDNTSLCLEGYKVVNSTSNDQRVYSSYGFGSDRDMQDIKDDGYHVTLNAKDQDYTHVATFAVRNPTDTDVTLSGGHIGLLFKAANYQYSTFEFQNTPIISHQLDTEATAATFDVGTQLKAIPGDLTCEVVFDGQNSLKNVANEVYFAAAMDVSFQLQLVPRRVGDDAIALPPNLTVPIQSRSTMIAGSIREQGEVSMSIDVLAANTVTTVKAEYEHEACEGGICRCEVKVYPTGVAQQTINITPAGNCSVYSKMKAHYYSDGNKTEVQSHPDTPVIDGVKSLAFDDPALGSIEAGGDVPIRGLYNLAQYDLHSKVPEGLQNKIVFGNAGSVEYPSPLQRKYDELIIVGRVVIGTKSEAGSPGAVALSGPVLYASVNPLSFEVTGIFHTKKANGIGNAIDDYKVAGEDDLNIVFEAILKKRRVSAASTGTNSSADVDNNWKPSAAYYNYTTFKKNTFLSEYMNMDKSSSDGAMNKRFEFAAGVDYVVPFMESSCTNMLPFNLPTYDYIGDGKATLTEDEAIIVQRATDLNNLTMCRYSRPFTYEAVKNGNANLNILALSPHNPIEKYPANLSRSQKMPKACDTANAQGALKSCWNIPENYMPKALKNPKNMPYSTHTQCHTRTCKVVEANYKYQCNCGSRGCSTCTASEAVTVCSDKYKAQCNIKETNASDECGDNTAFRFSGYLNQMVASLGCIAKYDGIISGSADAAFGGKVGGLVPDVNEGGSLASMANAIGLDLSGVSVAATLKEQGIIPYSEGVADLAQGGSGGAQGRNVSVAPNIPQVSLGGARPDLFSKYPAIGVTGGAPILRRERLRETLKSLAPLYPKYAPLTPIWVAMRANTSSFPTSSNISTYKSTIPQFTKWWNYWVIRIPTASSKFNKYGYSCIPCRFGVNGADLESSTTPLPMDQDSALNPRQPIYKFTRGSEPESCTELTTFSVRYFGSNECQPGDPLTGEKVENFCASNGFPSYGCSGDGKADAFSRPEGESFGGEASQPDGNSNYAGKFTVRLCSNSKFGSKNVSVSWSPIVIDIAGTGIFISRSTPQSVFFDITGDGTKEWVDWPTNTDGAALLVRPDKNGKVNSVKELFGDDEQGNGFEALKVYDSNKDGFISSDDKRYSELKLWFDYNRNGEVDDSSELKSLHSQGVQRIHLKYYGRLGVDGPEGRALTSRYYNSANKRFQSIMDVYFKSYGK